MVKSVLSVIPIIVLTIYSAIPGNGAPVLSHGGTSPSVNRSWYDYRGGYRPPFLPNHSKTKGVIKWRFGTKGKVQSSPAIGADGTVYVGSGDHKIYALNGVTGNLKWSYKTGDEVFSSPILDKEGSLYIGSNDHYVYALNAKNGAKEWQYRTNAEIVGSPSLLPNKVLLVGTVKGTVYAIKQDTGAKLWEFQTKGVIVASPIPGPDGSILAGSGDGTLYMLDGKTGKEIRHLDIDTIEIGFSLGIFATPIAINESTVYVCTVPRHVYAVDTNTWTKSLVFTTDGPITSTPAIDVKGVLYFGMSGLDGNEIDALDPASGLIIWIYKNGKPGEDFRDAPALDQDGTLYIGSDDHKLYAIDSHTGKMRWVLTTNGEILSSAAIAPNGNVYVGSDDGYVYCIR